MKQDEIEAENDRLIAMIEELLQQATTELYGGHGGKAIELLQHAKDVADRLPQRPECPTTKTDKTE